MFANVLTWFWHLVLNTWIWLPIGLFVVFGTVSVVLMVLARTLLFFSGVDPNTVANPGERDIKIWNKRHPENSFRR